MVRWALASLLWLLAGVATADYERGISAYAEGDYETALVEFRALADKGVVLAYTNLAYMYALGEGVEVDLAESARWLLMAAKSGSAAAQMTMGVLYFNGEGVERDLVQSYAWLSLAAAAGRDAALDYVYLVTERLSPDERVKARRLARRLFERYGDPELQRLLDDIALPGAAVDAGAPAAPTAPAARREPAT